MLSTIFRWSFIFIRGGCRGMNDPLDLDLGDLHLKVSSGFTGEITWGGNRHDLLLEVYFWGLLD